MLDSGAFDPNLSIYSAVPWREYATVVDQTVTGPDVLVATLDVLVFTINVSVSGKNCVVVQ